MEKVHSGQRPRTCRACGKQFEYPVKGSAATRHHCEDCVAIPAELRLIFERLNTRLSGLERTVKRLQATPTTGSPAAEMAKK